MYRNIMVAIDRNEVSQRALAEAISLAQEQKAVLRIVHVIEPATHRWQNASWTGASDTDEERRRYAAGLEIVAQAEAKAKEAGVEVQTCLLEKIMAAKFADAIIEEAEKWPADLLILGTHGRKGIGHLFIGSVAEGVIRQASIPVMVLRARTTGEETEASEGS